MPSVSASIADATFDVLDWRASGEAALGFEVADGPTNQVLSRRLVPQDESVFFQRERTKRNCVCKQPKSCVGFDGAEVERLRALGATGDGELSRSRGARGQSTFCGHGAPPPVPALGVLVSAWGRSRRHQDAVREPRGGRATPWRSKAFAAGHEIIRQRRRDLNARDTTPTSSTTRSVGRREQADLQLGWATSMPCDAIEKADPEPAQIEEYSHFGMVCRYMAGAANLPFFPIRSYYESDIPTVNRKSAMTSPYDPNDEVYVVPPLS